MDSPSGNYYKPTENHKSLIIVLQEDGDYYAVSGVPGDCSTGITGNYKIKISVNNCWLYNRIILIKFHTFLTIAELYIGLVSEMVKTILSIMTYIIPVIVKRLVLGLGTWDLGLGIWDLGLGNCQFVNVCKSIDTNFRPGGIDLRNALVIIVKLVIYSGT